MYVKIHINLCGCPSYHRCRWPPFQPRRYLGSVSLVATAPVPQKRIWQSHRVAPPYLWRQGDYMVNHVSLICSIMRHFIVDLSQLCHVLHLCHLRHLSFCFQFYKPFARLWSGPQFFVCCSDKMTSLDFVDMYFHIFDTCCYIFFCRNRR